MLNLKDTEGQKLDTEECLSTDSIYKNMGLAELQCIKKLLKWHSKHVLLDNPRTDLQCYTISKVDALILPWSA